MKLQRLFTTNKSNKLENGLVVLFQLRKKKAKSERAFYNNECFYEVENLRHMKIDLTILPVALLHYQNFNE